MKLKNQSPIFKIALLGFSLALYIVLSFASINFQFTRISLTGIPVIFAAVVYGPIEGMLIGGLGELFVQLMTYGLVPTTVLWLLPPIVRGLIVGLLFKQKNIKKHFSLWILTVILCCLAVTTLNTIAITIDDLIVYNAPQLTLIRTVFRFVGSVISAVLYIFIVPSLFMPLIKQGKFEDNDVEEPSVKELVKDKANLGYLIASTCIFALSIFVLVWTLVKLNLTLVFIYLALALVYAAGLLVLEKVKTKKQKLA